MSCTRPQLIAELARVDGRREVTLETIGRRLCASGLMATNGPYGAPAEMGWADAANLLIGANASLNAAEAPEAVARFRAFAPWRRTRPGSETQLPGEISEAETLGQALEALIATVPVIEESFLDFAARAFPKHLPSYHFRMAFGPLAIVSLDVEFTRGAHQGAVIRLSTRHLDKPEVILEIAFHPEAGATAHGEGDRLVTTRVSFETLRALYSAVSGRPLGAAAAPAPRPRREATSGDAAGGTPIREAM